MSSCPRRRASSLLNQLGSRLRGSDELGGVSPGYQARERYYRSGQYSEYFFELPRTLSAGYFFPFFSSLSSAAARKSTPSLSDSRTR